MKKLFVSILVSMVMIAGYSQEKSFYDHKVKSIDGEDFDFATLKGKRVMIVNTASKCGNTPQYEDLQELYDKFGGEDFVIIGFPANNFLNQEPGTDSEIKQFCTEKYSVTFPMMSKISVKGDDMAPIYRWLTEKKLNGVMDSEVTWNFQKYLVDETGRLSMVVKPKEKPTSDEILKWITE